MRWIVGLSLVSIGCATGSDARIAALEQRVATLEAKTAPPATAQPASKAPPADPTLDEKIDAIQGKMDTLQAELAQRPAQAPSPPSRPYVLDPTRHYQVPIDDSPAVGPAAAPVTIVAAVQFPEPFTHRAWPVLIALRGEYPKDLRLVFKTFIVHPRATASSIAACAAGQQRKLDKMEDAIYTAAETPAPGQPPAGLRQVDAVELRELARGLRLDLKQYDRDVTSCTAALDRDVAMFKALGQGAVPVFWINGRPLSGAQPIEAFRTVIEEERTAAAADKARGGKSADYYQRLTGGKQNPY